jgi:hypothetical protein
MERSAEALQSCLKVSASQANLFMIQLSLQLGDLHNHERIQF